MIDKAIKATGIESVYYRPVDELSKGFKQRVGLAQALVHEPDILILDEPTEGLDPNQRNDIRKLIKKASKEKTIILSTHVMQEVTAMCNRVMIIDKGRIVADSTKDDLTEGKQNIVEFAARGKNIRKELEKIDEIENIKAPPGRPRIKKLEITYTNRDKFFKKLSEAISKNKWTVYKINEKVISLEDIFYELTHGKKQ
jgi:ABC-2 type transport system ATP-binding protein